MADIGVTPEGFVRPRLPEIRLAIIEDFKARLRAAGLSDDIETRPDSVVGILVDTFADREAATWEMAEGVYASMYPGSATGASLDRAVSFAGVSRLAAEPSQCYVVCYGDQGTAIPQGAQIKNRRTQSLWELTEAVTISAQAAIDVRVEVATVAGSAAYTVTIDGTDYTYTSDPTTDRQTILNGLESALTSTGLDVSNDGVFLRVTSSVDSFSVALTGNLELERLGSRVIAQTIEPIAEAVEPGDLNHIVTLTAGWDAVDNLVSGTLGRATETDAELRNRYKTGVFRLGSSTVPAIEANVMEQVLGVTAVRVFQNTSDSVDDGLVPHSIQVVVDGGLETPIAEAIYRNKAAGIDTNGEIEVNLQTDEGAQTIKFDRPERVYIWVKVTITLLPADEGENFPSDGFERIAANIVAHGKESIIGQDVLPQRYYRDVFAVPGIQEAVIEVYGSTNPSASPSYSTDPIAIDRDQIADFSTTRALVL